MPIKTSAEVVQVQGQQLPSEHSDLRQTVLQALLNIISNPVNSTVPIAAEVLKSLGVYDKNRLLGVTTLDVVGSLSEYMLGPALHAP